MINVKLISFEDIISSNCIKIHEIVNEIEKAFVAFKKGEILLPDKISQVFDEQTQNRINCMPTTLLSQNISGIKWVSVFPKNPTLYKTKNVSGIIILSELSKGFPFAIVEAGLITAVRTACVGAIGAKYLARKNSKIYCSIGSGEQAKMHFTAIKTILPDIKVCKVASRRIEGEMAFVNEMSKKFPDVKFEACNSNYDKAAKNSDIIVTAVSCQEPLLKAKSISKGAYYCHVGGWEDEYDVALSANKIVCDNWECVKHRSQTISRMYKENILRDEDIYADLADIISGDKKGRENEEEFIYFNSVGLAFVDVSVAYLFYKEVCKQGKGRDWAMFEEKEDSILII